jgi:3-hydroxyacyl-CoA dehydrogenase
MSFDIRRAVVIGSGTMGGGIAAHFANAGIPVYLLDITQQVVAASYERMKKNKPPAFFTTDVADLVTIGALDEHEAWISEGDWILEAIVEQMEPKRELVARIDRLRKPGSIVSSNTSGLPIAQIAEGASADFKSHFLGTHFFNPPRYMKLLEVIPTPDTKPEVVEFVRDFAEQRLGKRVVFCKDTPNFIANRLASVGGAVLVDYVLEHGYTVEETDAIAGPLIGRPKTAAFRLQDLVGLDVASSVAANLYGLIPNDESREILRSPRVEALRKNQMDRGRLGDKTKQGFYSKTGKDILSVDLDTLEYRPRREPEIPSLAEAAKIESLPERLRFVLQQDDKAGGLARHVVYNALAYASRRVPEISDDLVSLDRAIRWGFSHDLGPFELWDALGVQATADAIEKEGIAVAPWVREMLASGYTSFYRDGQVYDPVHKSYVPVPRDPKEITGSPTDLGDGVLNLRGLDLQELARDQWVGAVLHLEDATLDPLSAEALLAVRYSAKPIVAAIAGKVLGPAAELAASCARVVAAAETYMTAPGCKEMIRRVVSPSMRHTPNADPLPLVQNALQAIAGQKVSSSAAEARELGFLGDADRIVMNRDHLLSEAKHEVLDLVEGYAPPLRDRNCFAAGRDVRAALRAGIYMLVQGGYIRESDAKATERVAYILCGGGLTAPQWMDEQYFLDLEKAR